MFKIHRGDITKLDVQCIVNASNESGLGCNIPNHCIDSAIHKASGSPLLEECKKLGGIPTGVAKITHAYNLPSKLIIHTTGPRKINNFEDHKMLSKCYFNCLNLAQKHNIKEIAFCCISTGLFGFDKTRSAKTALLAVMKWLDTHQYKMDTIIFVVFTDDDEKVYRQLFAQMKI